MTATPPRILAIAGSDSSGGAGIQADIKTITMLGGYAMTAITALTAQDTTGVHAVEPVAPEFLAAQIDACLSDIGADAVKIGMLGSPDLVGVVAEKLADWPRALVLDPVMVATSGGALADDATVAAMRELLFPLASVITPNLPELEVLTGLSPQTTGETRDAAAGLSTRYDCWVLAKDGHGRGERVTDTLVGPDGWSVAFEHQRIATRHTHGTGCTLSSAIATLLGHGQGVEHAVRLARQFVYKAIEAAPGFGHGHGPLGHQAVRGD